MNDPLNILHGGIEESTQTFSLFVTNYPETRFGTLTVNYRFGKAQLKAKTHNSALDEQGRL